MGHIEKVISFTRSFIKDTQVSRTLSDAGGGDISDNVHFSSLGDDAYPLDTDYSLTVDSMTTGNSVTVGYVDPKNEPLTSAGEKRIYSRETTNGAVVASMWLKNDGDVLISNKAVNSTVNASMLFKNDGDIEISNKTVPGTVLASMLFKNNSDIEISNDRSSISFIDSLQEEGSISIINISNGSQKRIEIINGTINSIILEVNGDIILSNSAGANITLDSPSGTITLNGVTIDASGNITSPTSVSAPSIVANNKELAEHTHDHGDPAGTTTPNN